MGDINPFATGRLPRPFQFRNTGSDPLGAIGVTMPPWPGDDEAVPVEGPWPDFCANIRA